MTHGISHYPNVRDKPGFLRRMMVELAGDARMSLEGNLVHCHFTDDLVVGQEGTAVLKRQTLWPRLDLVVLRLTPETVEPIF